MTKTYKVDFEYFTPEFADVTITADSSDEAEDKAYEEITKLFPEATDVEVTMVSEVS